MLLLLERLRLFMIASLLFGITEQKSFTMFSKTELVRIGESQKIRPDEPTLIQKVFTLFAIIQLLPKAASSLL